MWKTSRSDTPSSHGIETVVPYKVLSHLTTTADTLTFSADGQLLATASRMKRDAMRLIHVESMTAFSNWPTSKSPLHYVHSVAFSPSGGFLCVGNARGRAVTYRLHHYDV
jgi:U3 small nucleolar RNA-associated protein 18